MYSIDDSLTALLADAATEAQAERPLCRNCNVPEFPERLKRGLCPECGVSCPRCGERTLPEDIRMRPVGPEAEDDERYDCPECRFEDLRTAAPDEARMPAYSGEVDW